MSVTDPKFPKLHTAKTPLEYTLDGGVEEMLELALTRLKASRFGLFSRQPSTQLTNYQLLQNELTDVMAAVRMINTELKQVGLPPLVLDDEEAIRAKIDKFHTYSKASLNEGTLSERLSPAEHHHVPH